MYLICIDPPVEHAHHYLGFTEGPSAARRVAVHLDGQGSPLLRAALARGSKVALVSEWPGSRRDERAAKDRHNLAQFCPDCAPKLRERARLSMQRSRERKRKREDRERRYLAEASSAQASSGTGTLP